jgi:hypothetical protein
VAILRSAPGRCFYYWQRHLPEPLEGSMKLQTVAAACAAILSLSATAAFAAAEPVVAKLQQPVATPTKFIAGGAVFVCNAEFCVAATPTSQTLATATCKTIASKVGAVTSFGSHQALDDSRLAECNAAAAPNGSAVAKR